MGNYTSIEDENFFGAIGRLTISWAHLELGLDCLVEITYHGFGGSDIEQEIPRSLKRKLSYLRAVFRNMQLLPSDSLKGYEYLFNEIKDASTTRHDIIHGVVTEHVERSGEATMIRAIRTKTGITKRELSLTTTDIFNAAILARDLASKLLNLVNQVYDLIHELSQQDDVQKPL